MRTRASHSNEAGAADIASAVLCTGYLALTRDPVHGTGFAGREPGGGVASSDVSYDDAGQTQEAEMRHGRGLAVAMSAVVLAAAAACSGNSTRSDDQASDDAASGGDSRVAASEAPTMTTASPPPGGEGDGAEGPTFEDYGVNPTVDTGDDNRSTFALDVDTGSYAIARNHLNEGFLPDPAAVRTEEFVNYFPQDYEPPAEGIAVHVDGTPVPFLNDPSRRVARVGLQAATVADEDRPPAVLTFVIDTSGSMADAGKMEVVREALGRLVDALRPDDQVGIVTYSNEAEVRLEPTPVESDGAIRDVIGGLQPLESTNAEAGLRLGYEQAVEHRREGGINRVILLSDGVANVGETDPATLAGAIQEAAGDGIQLVTVGVGMGAYNDVLMEQLADDGDGFYAYVDTLREAERLFVNNLTGTLQVIGREAKVQVTFHPEAVASYRLLGFENRQVDDDQFRDDAVDGGEVGAGHSVTALYEIVLPEGGSAAGDTPLLTAEVRWIDPETDRPDESSAVLTVADLAESFDRAPDRLRQDILVAAFAESLRDAPWSEQVSLRNVADNAAALDPRSDDDVVAEFVELTAAAADLSG
jgi:Ca-activated chloride channel family protein